LKTLLKNNSVYLVALLFIAANLFFMWRGEILFNAIPIALLLVYVAFYHFEQLFLFVVMFTPLSVNIEEFVSSDVGLFLPTEPLLFGMLLILILNQMKKNQFDARILKHPISIIFILQLLWIGMTCISSEMPMVSIKFLMTKLWFIVPIFFYGVMFFKKESNVKWFVGLFIASLTIVVLYTLTNHAINGFDEESGHWVMFPFFKDHTSYGAILALIYPVFFGLLFGRKNSPQMRIILIGLIVLFAFAIIMSYTRAAWITLFGAFVVFLFIRFKVKFKYLAMVGAVGAIYVAVNWTSIMHSAEKNNAEHATENMNERLESMTNVTTDASNLERLNRWGCAIRLWQERPFLGWGPGTYAMVYAPFQLASGKTIISTNSGNRGNAHSEYLGPLSEQGLPGMLLMILLVVYICYTAVKLYIRMPEGEMRNLMLSLFLGLVTYFAHGILNNYLDTDKATIPVWGFTAIIVMLDLKYPVKKNSEVTVLDEDLNE
jgi:putative inorganic carbon (HCO3(-)) transporter